MKIISSSITFEGACHLTPTHNSFSLDHVIYIIEFTVTRINDTLFAVHSFIMANLVRLNRLVAFISTFTYYTSTLRQSLFYLFLPKPNVKRLLTSYTLIFFKNYLVALKTLRYSSELGELKLDKKLWGMCRA